MGWIRGLRSGIDRDDSRDVIDRLLMLCVVE